MTKVKQHQQVFDQELAQQGLRRTCQPAWIQAKDALAYVSREIIVKESDWTQSLTPWWKIKKSKTQRQK
jgi:hypothetical protein